MKKIIVYEHHNKMMHVFKSNKGKHQKNCLCYAKCIFFKPGEDTNCHIAQELYEFDVENNVTTPVWECVKYKNE